jgi:hypothetical protein
VWPAGIEVTRDVLTKDASKVVLDEQKNVIEALAPDAAEEPLTATIAVTARSLAENLARLIWRLTTISGCRRRAFSATSLVFDSVARPSSASGKRTWPSQSLRIWRCR